MGKDTDKQASSSRISSFSEQYQNDALASIEEKNKAFTDIFLNDKALNKQSNELLLQDIKQECIDFTTRRISTFWSYDNQAIVKEKTKCLTLAEHTFSFKNLIALEITIDKMIEIFANGSNSHLLVIWFKKFINLYSQALPLFLAEEKIKFIEEHKEKFDKLRKIIIDVNQEINQHSEENFNHQSLFEKSLLLEKLLALFTQSLLLKKSEKSDCCLALYDEFLKQYQDNHKIKDFKQLNHLFDDKMLIVFDYQDYLDEVKQQIENVDESNFSRGLKKQFLEDTNKKFEEIADVIRKVSGSTQQQNLESELQILRLLSSQLNYRLKLLKYEHFAKKSEQFFIASDQLESDGFNEKLLKLYESVHDKDALIADFLKKEQQLKNSITENLTLNGEKVSRAQVRLSAHEKVRDKEINKLVKIKADIAHLIRLKDINERGEKAKADSPFKNLYDLKTSISSQKLIIENQLSSSWITWIKAKIFGDPIKVFNEKWRKEIDHLYQLAVFFDKQSKNFDQSKYVKRIQNLKQRKEKLSFENEGIKLCYEKFFITCEEFQSTNTENLTEDSTVSVETLGNKTSVSAALQKEQKDKGKDSLLNSGDISQIELVDDIQQLTKISQMLKNFGVFSETVSEVEPTIVHVRATQALA